MHQPRGADASPRRLYLSRRLRCNRVCACARRRARCVGDGPALGLRGWGTSALLGFGCRAAHKDAARIGMAVSKIHSSGSVLAPQHFAGWCCAHRTNIPEVAGQSRRVPRHHTESFLLTLPGCGPPDPPTVDCADAGGGQRTGAVARSPRRPWRFGAGRGPASA